MCACPFPFDTIEGFILLSILFKGTLAIHDVIAINALYVKAALWGFEA